MNETYEKLLKINKITIGQNCKLQVNMRELSGK